MRPCYRRLLLASREVCASSTTPRTWITSKPYKRAFSSSSRSFDHYRALGIPRDSSRAQIKSAFYKLSKELHPDLNADGSNKERWLAVTEAYRTLIDDRKRRAYDRETSPASMSGVSRGSTSGFPTHPAYHGTYERPKHRATHAWDSSRHTGRSPHTDLSRHRYAQTHTQSHAFGPGSMNAHGIPRSRGQAYYGRHETAHNGPIETDDDKLNATNFIWRSAGLGAGMFALWCFAVSR